MSSSFHPRGGEVEQLWSLTHGQLLMGGRGLGCVILRGSSLCHLGEGLKRDKVVLCCVHLF